jgi:cytoskeletal protein CcmA (bactofilin family)
MRYFIRLFALAIFFLPAASIVYGASGSYGQNDSLSGQWEINMNTPGGVRTYKATFVIKGEQLTGEVERSTGNLPLKGTIKGSTIEFTYTVNYQGNPVEITMSGRVDGQTAGGTVSFNGNPAEEWSGRRIGGDSASTPGNDLTGTWNLEVETAQGAGRPTLIIKQSGESISGTYQGMLGEAPLSGSIKGDRFEISFQVSGQVEGKVVYQGTTDGRSMQGKVALAGIGEGTFTGRKKS